MKSSFFDASTFGLGELITQKKLFRVPAHQRSYSWSTEAVATFLADIENAFLNKSADYFVGLVVIQGPVDGEWILLDGQQRLTTVTMLYAAIRNWLIARKLNEDAKQIENEFLGVRRLGGEYSSRMLLNHENQQVFDQLVIQPATMKDVVERSKDLPKRSSNRLMVDAALECMRWVERLVTAQTGSDEVGAQLLFRLSGFVETKIKVVSVEVSSEVDAYTLFESLNDRGLELSALDLIKNYTFSKVGPFQSRALEGVWEAITQQLEESNRDDFLKVFWTSRFGVIQKTHLFRSLRNQYQTEGAVVEMVDAMHQDAILLSAIGDPDHFLWAERFAAARDGIFVLNMLGSKQARPVVLSGLHHLENDELAELVQAVIAVLVRFQIVGKGRTGVMEKVFGELCRAIEKGEVTSGKQARALLARSDLSVEDFLFETEFAEHKDSKLSRFAYFLAAIELHARGKNADQNLLPIQRLLSQSAVLSVAYLLKSAHSISEEDQFAIGNYLLVETEVAQNATKDHAAVQASTYRLSESSLPQPMDLPLFIQGRSHRLAAQAVEIWKL